MPSSEPPAPPPELLTSTLPESSGDGPPAPPPGRDNRRQIMTIIGLLVLWTYGYNLIVKEQGPVRAFFQILDTISDDFVMGSALTIGLGLGIVAVFSITALYGQIVANIYSFKIIEDLWYTEMASGRVREFFRKLLHFRDLPLPDRVCPERPAAILFSFCLIYFMSWVYVILFSEALFFVSWSSGVDLPITSQNMLLMPTLALAIPFSARVLAYLRYPYAQDYANFMPAAVFGLLMVTSLGYLFESGDQKFFLKRIYDNPYFLGGFLTHGIYLAFIPVFSEALLWLLELYRTSNDSGQQD